MENVFVLCIPMLVIAMIFVTRNVFLSLMLGLVVGGLYIHTSLFALPGFLFDKFYAVFFVSNEELSLAWGKVYIIGFLLSLGILGEFFLRCGGAKVFGSFARQKIKSKKQSEFVIFIFGIIIFIDGCFNAVILGQIARSLGQAYRVSKERLAYIVDSTSSPVCVLVPFSSWGASILAILQSNLENQNAFFVLIQSIGFNFYAWLTLICTGLVIIWQVNAPMQRFMITESSDEKEKIAISHKSPFLLFIPFLALFIAVFSFVIFDGYQKVGEFDFMQIFSKTDVNLSLFLGGIVGLLSAMICMPLKKGQYVEVMRIGIGSMLPAIGVLVLAWALAPMLKDDLQIASILSSLFENQTGIGSPFVLPIFLFLLSMLISFSTGTSWGCFAIMLPIGIELAQISGADVALAVASVLGGSLYGDHTSPISDTTILSSASTECLLQNHFVTQMFYAGICAACAVVAYSVYGLSESLIMTYLISLILLIVTLYGVKKKQVLMT